MKCFKQKVKHLLYEHQAHLSDVRAEGVMALKAAQDDHDVQEGELLKDKTELKASKRALEQEILEQIRAIKIVIEIYTVDGKCNLYKYLVLFFRITARK